MEKHVFDQVLEEMSRLYHRKNADYSKDEDDFSNFKLIALIADIPIEKAFLVMQAVKIARLQELNKGKTPQNEAYVDSLMDKAVYATIERAYYVAGNYPGKITYIEEERLKEMKRQLKELTKGHQGKKEKQE